MPSKKLLSALLYAALLLPAGVMVVGAFGRLLAHLGDQAGGHFFARIAQAGGIAWVLSLLGLLLAIAARTASTVDRQARTEHDEFPGDPRD